MTQDIEQWRRTKEEGKKTTIRIVIQINNRGDISKITTWE